MVLDKLLIIYTNLEIACKLAKDVTGFYIAVAAA